MYDVMFAKLAAGDTFNPDWTTEFSNLLMMLLEPPLVPYYHILGSKFCDKFLLNSR
ncbi:hypothetical protein [Chamaesiphon polymorphus]|uniref:hypothetical protein n=1 Tax=Chamaesiphon polymorphus TaxID=2107691 RepID=UPI0015E7A19F|nr:hypothetical protein [Chamaesiphon polymorphus]